MVVPPMTSCRPKLLARSSSQPKALRDCSRVPGFLPCGSGSEGVEALDVRPEGLELFDDALVAAINVVNALDEGFTFGHQRGEHQPGAGPQVGGLHGGSGELRGSPDHGTAPVDGNVGAHADHFAGV